MFKAVDFSSFLFVLVFLSFLCSSSAKIIVTGATTGIQSGSAPPTRKNIIDVAKDQVTWSLLVQALTQLQAVDQNDDLSYYRLSGIHGLPYRAWDNQYGLGRGNNGYCTHHSILFPSFHRAYLALYEQALMTYVQKVAATYTDTKYKAAADNFRIPYWDWAAGPSIPSILSSSSVTILAAPSGTSQTVNNPFRSYTFHPLNSTDFPSSTGSLSSYSSTFRSTSANNCLANQNLKSTVYNLMSTQSSFPNFATQANSGASLESPHGTVHNCVGGHMAAITYSGFDPLFWLHHTNVDRLYALWQTIYYNAWFSGGYRDNSGGTFAIPSGQTEGSNFPLPPFYQDSASQIAWTPDSSRSVAALGYTYPELVSTYSSTASTKASAVKTAINKLYGSSSTTLKRGHPRDLFGLVNNMLGNPTTREWIVSITVKKYALPMTFTVYCFFGKPPSDASTWDSSPTMVASMTNFVPEGSTPPSTADVLTTYADLPLNPKLKGSGLILDLLPDLVTIFLKSKLTWGIKQNDGTITDLASVPSLQVMVVSKSVVPAANESEFPTYGDLETHPEITNGKVGGGTA